jgi:hypothetical protein
MPSTFSTLAHATAEAHGIHRHEREPRKPEADEEDREQSVPPWLLFLHRWTEPCFEQGPVASSKPQA